MELEKTEHREINISRTLQLEMTRKDGTTVWTEVNISVIRNENQQPVGILGVTRDITERKRVSEALQDSEEQYRLVVENAKESIIITQDVKVVFVNSAAIGMMGYSKEILTLKSFTDFIHPDDRNMVVDHHIKRIKGEEVPPVYSFRVIGQDGTVIWCEINAVVIQWKGKPATLNFLNNITDRKRVDEELKESENKYRLLADHVDDVIFVLDMNLNYTYVSPSVKILLGYEPEELLKLQASETMTPSSWDLTTKNLSKIIETEKSEQVEITKFQMLQLEMRKKDGSTVWTEVKASFIRDKNNQPVGIIGVSRDITERKQTEQTLRESEERYRALFDRSLDLVYIMDFEGQFTDANSAALSRLGYKREEIGSLNFASLLSDDQLPLAFKTLQEIRETGTQKLTEFRLRHKNGSTVYVETRGTTIISSGTPIAIQAIARDITERKRADEELKESENKYRLLAENIQDVVFVMDMNLNYTYISPSVKLLRGYEPEEAMKHTPAETVTPSSMDLALRILSEMLEIEKSEHREINISRTAQLEMSRKDGTTVWVETKASFIRDENQRAVGIMGVTRNITERKQMDEELQQTLESLRKSVGATIQVMVSAVEMRDPYTAGHQIRAADLARAIATEMGLPQDKIEGIRMAGSIHDIGKLSIPAEILSKPTKLTDIEFSLIKEHSQSGYEMLKDVESPWPLAEIVYQHHERMNGSGYPRNLKGDEILIEARIMAVADVVEAMASHRPYRPSLGY